MYFLNIFGRTPCAPANYFRADVGVDGDKGPACYGHLQFEKLLVYRIDDILKLVGMVHGHGTGTHPLQGRFDLGFPGLGLGLLQVHKADVGLLEGAGKAHQDGFGLSV